MLWKVFLLQSKFSLTINNLTTSRIHVAESATIRDVPACQEQHCNTATSAVDYPIQRIKGDRHLDDGICKPVGPKERLRDAGVDIPARMGLSHRSTASMNHPALLYMMVTEDQRLEAFHHCCFPSHLRSHLLSSLARPCLLDCRLNAASMTSLPLHAVTGQNCCMHSLHLIRL